MELHYCKGKVTDIAFFGGTNCICLDTDEPAPKMHCHDQKENKCQHHSKKHEKSIEKKTCCDTENVDVLEDVDFNGVDFQITTPVVLALYFNPFLFEEAEVETLSDEFYQPPAFWVDIPILHQSFLI